MIVRAAEPEEYADIYDIVDRAFRHAKLERTIMQVTTGEDPNFQRGDLRVVEVDGKIVSMMMLMRRPLRIGTAIVNGAIVAPVATLPAFEGRGYCSAVMRDAIQYMKAQGFDITILWGHPWLYQRYGYSPAMLKTEVVMKCEQHYSVKKSPYEFRPFSDSDLEQVTRVYHSNTATRTCAEVRSPWMWEWKPRGPEAKLEVLTDNSGVVIGYLALGTDWGRPCALEVGVLNDEACEAVFNRLLETMRDKELKEFPCLVHPDHPFARFAFWRGGEVRIRSGGGAGMARVLNLAPLLTKMDEEFERRLSCSELHDLECTLGVLSEESAVLDIDDGQISVSTDNVECDCQLVIPLASLNPLVTGYEGIGELIEGPRVEVNGGERALRLIEVLFPTGYPSGGFFPLVWE